MRFLKKGMLLTAVCALLICLPACGGQRVRENLLGGFNEWLQAFSRYALTPDKALQGVRTSGEDAYTGTYEASYDGFCGKEFLFGGTALKRDAGNDLTIAYTLEIISGSGMLYWQDKAKKHAIASVSVDEEVAITLSSGDNYLVLEGDGLTGSLKVSVE